MRGGQSLADVASAFGLNIRTVYDWLAKFAEGGQMPCWRNRFLAVR